MYGFTMCIISQIGLLHGTGPLGRTITLVPGTSSKLLSTLALFDGGPSWEWFRSIGSGMGIFNSWWTFDRSWWENPGVSNSSLSLTIFSGNPFTISCSA